MPRGSGGQVQATEFYLQNEGPFAHFGYLCRNIQQFFKTGQAPYPPERTLLTTGVIDAAMISRYEGHRRVETPYLDIAYQSYDQMPQRPLCARPSGGLHRSAVARHSVGLSVHRAGRRRRENSVPRLLETTWQRGKSTIQQVPFSPTDRPRV